jgi:hypothetical protein
MKITKKMVAALIVASAVFYFYGFWWSAITLFATCSSFLVYNKMFGSRRAIDMKKFKKFNNISLIIHNEMQL